MVTVRKTVFVRFVAITLSIIAIAIIVSGIVLGVSSPPKNELQSSTRKDYSATDQILRDVPHYNPNHPASEPDPPSSESKTSPLTTSNIHNPSAIKPQGKSFPINDVDLQSLLLSDKAAPVLEKEMINLLSSLVSPVSQPNITANLKTKNNVEFQSEMIEVLTSIVSPETNRTERESLVDVLSSLVSEHGIDPDIKNKMTQVLQNIVYRQETDPKVKLQMAKLMSDVISQDSDEALKWGILNTLSKISSQDMETESKSRMVTILSAIAREEDSPEVQLDAVTTLSSILHRYGEHDTRANMVQLLSLIVPSAESLESTTEDATESKFLKKPISVDEKVEMVNLMLDLARDEKEKKGAEQLIHIISSIVSPVSQPNINPNVKTKNNVEFQTKMLQLFTSIVSPETNPKERGSLVEVLSSLVSEYGIDRDIKKKMTHVLLNMVYRHETDPEVKLQMTNLMSNVISQDSDEALKWKILNTLSQISSQDMETESKSRMVTILSVIARGENSPEKQLKTATELSSIIHRFGKYDTRLEMAKLLSVIVPSAESLESTTEDAAEPEFPKKPTSADEKVEMGNIMLTLTQDQQETKTAEQLLHVLSSIASPDSQPNVKANVIPKNNIKIQSDMIKILIPIVSRETNPTERESLVEVLLSLVSEYGIDPDIKEKMTQVLMNIVYRHETDPEIKLQMAKLMSDVISQDSDDALKWKILNTLLKISSQDMETESKSRMVTVLSRIAREENSPDLQLKAATTLLSSLAHRYAEHNTRLDMARMLSMIVPSPESLESTTEDAAESVFPRKPTSADEKVEIGNIMLNLTQDKKEKKVAEQLIHLLSSIISPVTQSNIKANVKTKNNLELKSEMLKLLTHIVPRETNPTERETLVEVLSSLVSEYGIDRDIKEKMANVLLDIVNETDPDFKLQTAKLMSDVISQDTDEALKWKILDTLSKISSHDMETESKSRMVTILSAITEEESNPEKQLNTAKTLSSIVHRIEDHDTRLDMVRLLSIMVPSTENLESTPDYTAESKFPKKPISVDEKVEMVNLMLDL